MESRRHTSNPVSYTHLDVYKRQHDYYRLLNHIENGELYDDGLVKLIKSYKDLSSFSKGMLIERAECLKEWDKMREDKRKILEENKLKK